MWEREIGLGVLKYIKRVKRDVQSFDIKLEKGLACEEKGTPSHLILK